MKFAWSHSRLKVFETCPAQYEGKFVEHLKEDEGEAAKWGERVHEDLEKAVRDGVPMPEATKPYEWAVELGKKAQAVGARVEAEYKMGLTVDLKPCGFMDGNVWLRGKSDLSIIGNSVAAVWDYKTGKQRAGNTQLNIMAAMTFEHFPVERVEAKFLWLQNKKQSGVSHNRKDLPALWEELIARAKRVERAHETGVFQPIPSWACNYCPVKTCRYNKVGK